MKTPAVHLLSLTTPGRFFCGRKVTKKASVCSLGTLNPRKAKGNALLTTSVTCGDCLMALSWVSKGGFWKHAETWAQHLTNAKTRRQP